MRLEQLPNNSRRLDDDAAATSYSAQAHPRGHKRKRPPPSAPITPATAPAPPIAQLTPTQRRLQDARRGLPIWPLTSRIRYSLWNANQNVLLLAGDTGCGKSTQVPQFLASQHWCSGRIAVTQPRRVAAVTLARRVAQEMWTQPPSASGSSKVGYSVRFDNAVGRAAKIKYLTEGMLLQELLRDRWLQEYSCVIVDEVHERSVNVDLILGFLRRLLSIQARQEWKDRRGKPLKVVIMSATADMAKFLKFFDEAFHDAEPSQADDDAMSSWSGFSSPDGDQETTQRVWSKHIAMCEVEGRQFPVEDLYLPEPAADYTDAIAKTVFKIHYSEPLPGDILVFLPGQETIESLEQELRQKASTLEAGVPKLLVLPLFAALSQHSQHKVFEPTPRFTRKVILATNIAETSITVPGIRHVIDSGLHKIKEYRSQLSLDTLLVKPISQSSAVQRRGRAGRDAPGKCWRMYTEASYRALEPRNAPEMLRCDLAGSVLLMKARGVDDVLSFPLLDSPGRQAMREAVRQLRSLGAVDEDVAITRTGRYMSRLPLSPALARVLLAAADAHGKQDAGLVEDVIDVIACLTAENIFVNLSTEEEKEEAEEGRRELFRREGDLITMLATVHGYAAEHAQRGAWCERHFVSHRAMKNVMLVRKQLRLQCRDMRLLGAAEDGKGSRGGVDGNGKQTDGPDGSGKQTGGPDASSKANGSSNGNGSRDRHDTHNGNSQPSGNGSRDRHSTHKASPSNGHGYGHGHGHTQNTKHFTDKDSSDGDESSDAAAPGPGPSPAPPKPYSPEAAETVLKLFMTGFGANVAALMPDGSYKTLDGDQTVAIHPSSVLFGRKLEAIMYDGLVFTTKCYARTVSAVRLGWYEDVVLRRS